MNYKNLMQKKRNILKKMFPNSFQITQNVKTLSFWVIGNHATDSQRETLFGYGIKARNAIRPSTKEQIIFCSLFNLLRLC